MTHSEKVAMIQRAARVRSCVFPINLTVCFVSVRDGQNQGIQESVNLIACPYTFEQSYI